MFKRFFLTALLSSISVFALISCSEDADPLELTIDLPLNETMAWQGAYIKFFPDSTVIVFRTYIEMTMTDTLFMNDTLFYSGTIRWVDIGWSERDTTGPILISKTSIYLQQNFQWAYPGLLKQKSEQPAPPTWTRIKRVLMPVRLTEGKRQRFVQPDGDGWIESRVTIHPLGQRKVGPYTGMGVKVEFDTEDGSHHRNWLVDHKGKLWTLNDYGSIILTDSVGNDITTFNVKETFHRIPVQSNPSAYLKTQSLADFYLNSF